MQRTLQEKEIPKAMRSERTIDGLRLFYRGHVCDKHPDIKKHVIEGIKRPLYREGQKKCDRCDKIFDSSLDGYCCPCCAQYLRTRSYDTGRESREKAQKLRGVKRY